MSNEQSGTEAKKPKAKRKLADLVSIVTAESPKVLSNFTAYPDENGKEIVVPLEPHEVWDTLKHLSGNAVKRCAEDLFIVLKDGDVHFMKKTSSLFGQLFHVGMKIAWADNKRGCITKSEFMDFCLSAADYYDFIMEYPLYPPMKNVFHKKHIEPQKNGKLDQLLDFFKPHSLDDRDFLKASFITPFWGGSAGKKPAFVFDGAEENGEGKRRGIGKSTIIEAMARLLGENYIDLDYRLPVEDIKKRLLGASGRIVRFDNVKSAMLSSEAIENLITAEYIAGHKMYQGDSAMPNFFTYCFTFNDAAFSKDLAQRAIVVRLDRPEYDAKWEERLYTFIDAFRTEIIADIGAVLMKTSDESRKQWTRFSRWEKEVLQKCSDKDLGSVIKDNQRAIDDDSNFSDEIKDLIESKISDYETTDCGVSGRGRINPETDRVAIKTTLLTEWMREIMGKGNNDRYIRKKLMSNRPEQLSGEQNKIEGTRFFVWNENGSGAAWKLVHGVKIQEQAEPWNREKGPKVGGGAAKMGSDTLLPAPSKPLLF